MEGALCFAPSLSVSVPGFVEHLNNSVASDLVCDILLPTEFIMSGSLSMSSNTRTGQQFDLPTSLMSLNPPRVIVLEQWTYFQAHTWSTGS